MKSFKETGMKIVFLICACVSIIAVFFICVFLFANGFPTMAEIGVWDFLSGTTWAPLRDVFGIFPMILGSIYVTAGAIIVGVPVGLLTAIYMARFCPKKIYRVLKPAMDLLAGVPSIVYGLFGLVVIVPLMRELFDAGKSLLTASLMLGIMILPTIISVCEAAIRAVPESYYEGSLALGATHERSVFLSVVPAARSGVLAGIVLGIGRAIGEATAVSMVAGNQAVIPTSITEGLRTLTTNIILEMGYAQGLHREALIATAVVLFIFVMLINVSISALRKGDK